MREVRSLPDIPAVDRQGNVGKAEEPHDLLHEHVDVARQALRAVNTFLNVRIARSRRDDEMTARVCRKRLDQEGQGIILGVSPVQQISAENDRVCLLRFHAAHKILKGFAKLLSPMLLGVAAQALHGPVEQNVTQMQNGQPLGHPIGIRGDGRHSVRLHVFHIFHRVFLPCPSIRAQRALIDFILPYE